MLSVIDLFCGAGCFSEGFRQAGFKIVAGVDNWKVASKSFHANFPEAESICHDIRNLLTLPSCDVIIGSPPCQEWSIGKQGKRNFDTSLIEAFEKIVEETKPTYWVWECAPLTSMIKPCQLLNAYNFGVPQNRLRAFHANFPLPQKTEQGKNLDEVFGWKTPKVLFNHRSLNTTAHSPVYLSNRPARTAVT